MRFKRFPARALAVLALALPIAAQARSAPAEFVPEVVFSGHSEGRGTLRLGIGRVRSFQVSSDGQSVGGAVRLHQHIRFQGQPPSERLWTLRPSGSGRYAGTLTDAAGPVDARVMGRRLTVRYAMRRGLVMHQTLDLASDGRTIDNRATVRFLGLPVGWLRENIVLAP